MGSCRRDGTFALFGVQSLHNITIELDPMTFNKLSTFVARIIENSPKVLTRK
jgi:hypothetical protein